MLRKNIKKTEKTNNSCWLFVLLNVEMKYFSKSFDSVPETFE